MTDQSNTPHEAAPQDAAEGPTGRPEIDAPLAPTGAGRSESAVRADEPADKPATSGAGVIGWASGRGRWLAAGGLAVLLALGIGAAGYSVGAAGDGDESTSQSSGDGRHGNRGDGNGNGNGEDSLTGTMLDEVTAAVEAEYPGSTIVEAETESDGVYEAHIVTAEGDELTVELDQDFEITDAEED